MTLTVEKINAIASAISLSQSQRAQLAEQLKPYTAAPAINATADNTSLTAILTPVQAAADSRNIELLREVQARCGRMGFYFSTASPKKISLPEIDAAFAGRDVEERLRCKAALRSLHLI